MQDSRMDGMVNVLTDKVDMRFMTTNKSECHLKGEEILTATHSLFSTLKSYINITTRHNTQPLPSQPQSKPPQKQPQSQIQPPQLQPQPKPQPPQIPTVPSVPQSLKFAIMLTPQHLLIGNDKQLDLIHIQTNPNNYVDTEHMWSIRNRKNIAHVCVEYKKINMLVIVADFHVYVYHYDAKKVPLDPIPHTHQIQLQVMPKFVHIVRESNICLFFEQHLEIYIVTNNIRRRYNDKYLLPTIPRSKFSLFFVPENFQNYINIFFEQKSEEQPNIFTLWCIELQFTASDIKAHPIQKVYDIKESLKSNIQLKNYSKEIFLLNLGNQVLALKRGYVLDSANVYMKKDQSLLQYVGNNTLLHITTKKIEVYNFNINLLIKPFKIQIRPRDSIKINGVNEGEQFFRVLPIFSQDHIIIFKSTKPQKRNEQQYSFYITRKLTRQQKMLQLFPKNLTKFRIEDPVLIEKCDMAHKMGYSKREIYLQLWNKSEKASKEDYSTLIATQDYATIAEEIVRKLKKSSVHLKEVLETQYACLEMLRQRVYSAKCTYQTAMNYISCHFFKRKLQMFKAIKNRKRLQQQQKGNEYKNEMKITIRQYQFYKNMELKNQLLTYITELCTEGPQVNREQICINIRFLLRHFRFALRTKYEQILEEIIKNTNNNLLILLKHIPEILPYHPGQISYPSYIQIGFYQGIWSQITKQQWQNESMYIDKLTIIDNKQIIVEQVVKHINFKRFWLSQHDMVTLSTDQIKENYQKIRSPHIFYFFIAKLFQYVQDQDVLGNIVQYLEEVYSVKEENLEKSVAVSDIRRSKRKSQNKETKMVVIPQSIKGKVFLLQRIYQFFKSNNLIPLKNGHPCTLIQFFHFQDHELIGYCFQKQRSIKGILLKDIKQIYKQSLPNHTKVFNQALLNYFMSDLSQISDLKYLLNRINNQKRDFHKENKEMYMVLIQALQRKLKIGTDKDIPIDQVLIYLQNLPFHSTQTQLQKSQPNTPVELTPTLPPHLNESHQTTTISKAQKQLNRVHSINKYSKYLQQSRINMSIYEILRNPEEVFTHLIQYIVKSAPTRVWVNMESFVLFATQKISEVELFANRIYSEDGDTTAHYNRTIFFIFLAKLCEETQHIKFAKVLISDPRITCHYNEFKAQGLVQFMYRWKMSANPSFLQNQSYIQQLLTLIPPTSTTHIFIHNELEFSKLLSYNFSNEITFPISETVLNCRDIKEIVNQLPIQFVMGIDVEKVYGIVHQIQSVVVEKVDIGEEIGGHGGLGEELEQIYHKSCMDRTTSVDPSSLVTLPQIYQIFIIKYLHQKKLKQVITLIKSLLQIPKPSGSQNYDIIFPIMYIIQLSEELNDQNRENLLECIWYYFYHPKQLMDILEDIVMTALTPLQLKKQIQNRLRPGKENYRGYNPQNIVFNCQYIDYIGDSRHHQTKFAQILHRVTKHITESKQQFKALKYSVILIILYNSPYLLSKFIECTDEHNIKSIRSLISYAILEDVFEPLALLELARRVFLILLESYVREFPTQVIMEEFQGIDIRDDMDFDDYQPDDQRIYQQVMWKSAEAFRKKKKHLSNELMSGSKLFKKQKNMGEKLEKLFMGEQKQISAERSSYIFTDSDNEEKMHEEIRQSITKRRSKKSAKFIPKAERLAIFQSSRLNKPCALYKSIQGDFTFRKNRGLFVSTTQSFAKNSNLQVKSPSIRKSQGIRSSSESIQIPALHSNHKSHKVQVPQQDNNQINISIHSQKSQPKSSPDIQKSFKKVTSQIQNQLEDNIAKLKLCNKESIGFRYDSEIQQIQEDRSCEEVSNVYEIHVKEVSDQDDEEDDQYGLGEMRVSKEMKRQDRLSIKELATMLMSAQHEQPYLQGEYDLQLIEHLRGNSFQLIQLIKQLYQSNQTKPTVHKSLQIITQIILQFSPSPINKPLFKIISKMQQVQSKTIPEIPFSALMSASALVKFYESKEEIFQEVYAKLQKFVDSQNIYTVSQFVRRVFDQRKMEEVVIWDFLMDLCGRIQQSSSPQEKEWNLEKIQATLPKIDVVTWNNNFDKFKEKVLGSESRDKLLEIFFKALKQRVNKQQNLKFLKNIQQVHQNERITQMLNILQNE